MGELTAIHLSLSLFSFFVGVGGWGAGGLGVQMSSIRWLLVPTALKHGYIANFNILFLVMGFISLVDEIYSMLNSS